MVQWFEVQFSQAAGDEVGAIILVLAAVLCLMACAGVIGLLWDGLDLGSDECARSNKRIQWWSRFFP